MGIISMLTFQENKDVDPNHGRRTALLIEDANPGSPSKPPISTDSNAVQRVIRQIHGIGPSGMRVVDEKVPRLSSVHAALGQAPSLTTGPDGPLGSGGGTLPKDVARGQDYHVGSRSREGNI
ncbi:hypothetical protein N7539_009008 [Penicillium diatomitis]|uniref:Uncharacterized protein n=1 Tax=Penicillium diatomitis TaxID=2819901 RepID=A0A9W9WKY6_9EURO|nr:uncharacterized protein N7539_009008 [Penicillium diatomitis]KAJ5469390.1 hypothetical protein N7539_009008 [Penicillium diatomitis]